MSSDIPTTDIDLNYILGEVKELIDEIRVLDINKIIDEACDVYICFMSWLYCYYGINFPIINNRTINKYNKRIDFFKYYFNEIGLEYKLKYLKNGGNYKKDWKRIRAVRLAIRDQLKKEGL
jgi:hypothetical protein